MEEEIRKIRLALFGRENDRPELMEVIAKAEEVFGIRLRANRNRHPKSVMGRATVAYIGRSLGYSDLYIGKILNRNRTTILMLLNDDAFKVRYRNFPEFREMAREVIVHFLPQEAEAWGKEG